MPAPSKSAVALTVASPFDGHTIAEIPITSERQLEDALQRAHSLFRDRDTWLPLHERVAVLERTAVLMESHHADLARLAATEGGKPLIDSQIEVTRAIDSVRLCIEQLRGDAGHVVPMGGTAASAHRVAFTQKEPIGVVVAVSAFNHPLNLIVHQVAPAVATGCPVIVKPAAVTPLSCLRFIELLHEAGLPDGWAEVAVLTNDAHAEALVTDPRVGFFSFIGSARVGWMLRSKLARGVRCALEHGGAAPVILADDADLERAVSSITKGGYYHAGQVCVSVQRVFAPQKIAHDFADALSESVHQLKVGDPLENDTDVGPLIRTNETQRVESWVSEAISQGAQLRAGGQQINDHLYAPTVLVDPPMDAKVSRLEIFGPVVNVYGYTDIDAALSAANDLPFAFQAAVFTQDVDRALAMYRALDASAVMLNDHSAFRVDGMPFAGLRESGLGVGGIPHTMDDMQLDKMLVINSPAL
jgi:acyl-CoA reductase-like NAD-dependent aldehyde dehydrogenase